MEYGGLLQWILLIYTSKTNFNSNRSCMLEDYGHRHNCGVNFLSHLIDYKLHTKETAKEYPHEIPEITSEWLVCHQLFVAEIASIRPFQLCSMVSNALLKTIVVISSM